MGFPLTERLGESQQPAVGFLDLNNGGSRMFGLDYDKIFSFSFLLLQPIEKALEPLGMQSVLLLTSAA